MNKENKITVNNLLYALLFLVLGIFLLTSTEDIIEIVSKIIGCALIIIGIIRCVIFIYMKGKLGDYNLSKLIFGLLIISFGVILIVISSALSITIRVVVGIWIVFSGINRLIFAIPVKTVDKKGFYVYLCTSLLMFALGILLISGIFSQIIGLFIIIYSITEIVNYIYYKVKNKNYTETTAIVSSTKVSKKSKKGKIVDAIIEEEKEEQ